MIKQHIKLFIYLAIITYLIVCIATRNFISSIGTAVTIAVMLETLYSSILWRFSPFEKTPRLKRKYKSTQVSSYCGGTTYTVDVTVRQTLFSVSISEKWEGNRCMSVSSSILKEHNGDWALIYTYLARPATRIDDHIDDMHYGTVILHIDGSQRLFGSYYTNRQEMTKGTVVWEAI